MKKIATPAMGEGLICGAGADCIDGGRALMLMAPVLVPFGGEKVVGLPWFDNELMMVAAGEIRVVTGCKVDG
ncbi:hypothetical protein M0R45_025726 [Rubus argutus]|uniref:Uncharacterized protein n=1 Tax=Rubus argutus TaxID=59490 RepID=A0AAW1WV08_RUBAR